jgi:hypothetical protein
VVPAVGSQLSQSRDTAAPMYDAGTVSFGGITQLISNGPPPHNARGPATEEMVQI